MPALSAGVALLNAAMGAASAVSTIAAVHRLGIGWAAVPNTAGVVGTGIGALALSHLMSRHGPRAGLVLGYFAATVGAGLGAYAVTRTDAIGLTLGMLLLGLGNAAAQLSRYTAADLYPATRRGFAIGAVVWAATLGAVGGPLLLAPSSRFAMWVGGVSLAGPYLFAMLACAVAAIAASAAPTHAARTDRPGAPMRDLLRTPAARSAFAVMVTGHVIMVAVMTAAPLDMHRHGHGMAAVGTVLSAHTLGMFALSPLTGRLLDRYGAHPVMVAGLVTLAVAAGVTAASGTQPVPRVAGLFLLGYAWNLCFIGGSGRLARDLPAVDRARVEGAVDAGVWSVAALASLLSTVALEIGGYGLLAGSAAALVIPPLLLLHRLHRT